MFLTIRFGSTVLKVILGIGLLLFIPLIFPILIYRQILSIVGPYFSKKLGKILSPQSQHFLSFNRPEVYNVLIWFKLSGKLNSDLVKERFRTKCLLARNVSGDFIYPEFQQYPTTFGGYAFWQWEESFDMEKHIRHVTLDQETDTHAQFERMLQTPLPENASPWEATFLEFGDNKDCHFICLKFHHSLCDGEAIFDVLMRAADSKPHRIQFPEQPKTSCFDFFRNTFYFISSYFNVIYNATDATPMIFDASNVTGVRRFPMSRCFDLGQVKQLKSKLGVSVSIAMLGVLTGAIRRKLQNEGKPVPKQIVCMTAILAPNHPQKLTNKLMLLDMALPVDTVNGYKRLAMLERQAQKERMVKSSYVRYFLQLLHCSMPRRWMTPVPTPVVASIFPGPTKKFCICGNPVEDMAYSLHGGTHALMVNVASYNGNFRYWLGIDANICSTEQNSAEFIQYLDDELCDLMQLDSTTIV